MLRPATRPVPQPGAGEVLIRVAAAGVNRPDVLQRMGFYPPPPGASDLPGLEVAGTVVAVGPGSDPEMLGQAVCALVAGGGYAEYCVAPTGSCLPVPRGFSIAEAAALADSLGLECHAGHGLDYETVAAIAAIPQMHELNIGHFLMGESLFIGLEAAIRRMRRLMDEARSL